MIAFTMVSGKYPYFFMFPKFYQFFMFLKFYPKIRSQKNLVLNTHSCTFVLRQNPFIYKKIHFMLLLKSWRKQLRLFFHITSKICTRIKTMTNTSPSDCIKANTHKLSNIKTKQNFYGSFYQSVHLADMLESAMKITGAVLGDLWAQKYNPQRELTVLNCCHMYNQGHIICCRVPCNMCDASLVICVMSVEHN